MWSPSGDFIGFDPNMSIEERFAKLTLSPRIENTPPSNVSEQASSVQDAPQEELQNSLLAVIRRPMRCFHDHCRQLVTFSGLIEHFKRNHSNIPTFGIVRKQELGLPFDARVLEFGRTLCLAIVSMYEANGTDDVAPSRSPEDVINAGGVMSRKALVNTFWLCLTSSPCTADKRDSYVFLWLYSNDVTPYPCTLELTGKNAKSPMSIHTMTVGLNDKLEEESITRSTHCLLVPYIALGRLLREGNDGMLLFRLFLH